MRTAMWAGLLVMAMFAGCLGDVQPAEISDQTLQQKGWSQTDSSDETVAFGLGQITTRDYRPSGGTDATGATVASTTDVPILDERRFIPQALERVEEQRGISFQEDGTTTVSLPSLGIDSTEADVYTFTKGGADGKAILITPEECDSFVISVGYGVTGTGGFQATDKTYQEAKEIARNVVC